MLQACLNGDRAPGRHPALPLTPEALARDAAACVAAGAGSLHLHPRDATGLESLAGPDVAAALDAVRAACPGVPVGVSSGLWITGDAARRLEAVRGWTVRPDFVSVNWHEPGAEALAASLLEAGVGVEAGLFHVGAARAFARSPLAPGVLRALVEVHDQPPAEAERTAGDILLVLEEANVAVPRLLHGSERSAWPLVRLAGGLGLDTRVGLEDTLILPDGARAADNAALVVAAARVLGGAAL